MPLDPRIPMGFQFPTIEPPANALAKVMGLQHLQNQNALNAAQLQGVQQQQQMRAQQMQQQQQRAAAMQGWLQGFPDPPPDAPPQVQAYVKGAKAGAFQFDIKEFQALMDGSKPTVVGPDSSVYVQGKGFVGTAPSAPPKPPAPTPLAGLIAERDALPPNDPRRPTYDAAIAKATTHQPAPTSITKIENFEPANTQLQKGSADALMKNFENLQNIPSTLGALRQAKTLAQNNPFVGSMGDSKLEVAKFFNNNLGTSISPQQVANAETLKSALFVNVMDNLKKMDAQPSEMQQKMMMDSMGRLTTDPKALPQILDLWTNILESKAKEHNRRVSEAKKNGATFLYDISVNTAPSEIKMPTPADIAAEAQRRYGNKGQ